MPTKKRIPRKRRTTRRPDLDALEDRRLLNTDFQAFGTDEPVVSGLAET